jgi:hypothetical protein
MDKKLKELEENTGPPPQQHYFHTCSHASSNVFTPSAAYFRLKIMGKK